jgi:hypothetical protein
MVHLKPYRVPLAGPYTSRISAVNASDSTSGYVGVGIVGLMIVGKSTQATDKDARFINCFAQTADDPINRKKYLSVVKRPGFGTNTTPAAGQKGYAVMVWTGNGAGTSVISGFGDTNSTIYNGTSSLGAITGRVTGITETSINGTPTIAVTSTDDTGWYADSGVMTEITDAQWPGDTETIAGTFAHMDGFPFIMTTRARLHAGDVNSITAWTANSFGAVNAYPDVGVGAIRWKNFIMAFCQQHIEFWYNAGLSPFPLARSGAMTQKVGAVSADAIARIADTIFWCGTTPEGGMSIFQWDGNLSRVSAPEVEAIMILAGASNISLTTIRFYGRSFILVKAGPTTLAYCIEEKMWHEWNSTTPLWYKCASVMLGGTQVNYAVSNVSSSGKVYLMNHASLTFEDDGTTYTARIQTAPTDEGTNKKKFYADLSITADVESSASTLTIAASDDDYATYTTLGTVDLSAGGQLKITRLGSARRRAWALTHSANTPMRIHRAEGTLTVGL